MDIEKIKRIILESANNHDPNYFINNMSLEERLYLIYNLKKILVSDKINDIFYGNEKLVLFSMEEISEYTKDVLNNSNEDFKMFFNESLNYYEEIYELEIYDKYSLEMLGRLFNYVGREFLIEDYIMALDEEDKIEVLNYLNDDYKKMHIINSLDSDELKRDNLVNIESSYYKLQIIMGFESDYLKKDCLNLLESSYSKIEVMKTIHDESVVLECLNIGEFEDEIKVNFIRSLNSDKIKLIYLPLLVKLYYKDDVLDKEGLVKKNFNTDEGIREVTSKIDRYEKVFEDVNGLIDIDDFFKYYDFFKYDKNIDKIKLLFDKNNFIMNKGDLDSVLESFVLKEFKLSSSDIWNIFSKLKYLIDKKEKEIIKKELTYILKYAEKTKNYIGRELLDFINEYNYNNDMLDMFINDLLNKENIDKHNLSMNRLKKITTQYINLEIEEYKKEKKDNIYEIINKNKKIEKNYLIKNVTSMNRYDVLVALINKLYPNRVSEEIKEALKYKINDPEKTPSEIKKYFKELNNIFIDLYYEHYEALLCYMKPNNISIKYDKNVVMDNSGVRSVLLKHNINTIIELCSNMKENEFNTIEQFVRKYHLFAFSDLFNEKVLSQIGVNIDLDFMINKLDKLNGVNIDNVNLLDFLASFSDQDKLLKYLINDDNKNYIVSNPAPNSASLDVASRKEIVGSYIVDMYKKDKVYVPVMDKNYQLSAGKVINVNVGNFTNPINLTYGERTGSCMRIGGAGADLFDFCLNNKAGIHIRFSTKEGKFISRVSGFRVGNTLFLNELRESMLDDINNEELVEVCKKVAEDITQNTKNSKYPIENVIVSNLCALSGEGNLIDLNVNFYRDGIKVPKYFDVETSRCLLLATSNCDKGRQFVPFNDTPMEEYDVLRDKIKYIDNNEEVHNMINKIKMIDQLLDGTSQKDLVIEESDKKYKWGYFGEDFYVVMDKDNNIETYYMYNSKNVEKAKEEMKELLNTLKKGVDYNELDNNASYSRGVINFLMIIILLVFLMIVIVMM